MTTSARARFTGYRFPAEIISYAVWLYFRFPPISLVRHSRRDGRLRAKLGGAVND